MITDRLLPPQSIEAEMAVLGGIFVDHDSIGVAMEHISVEDFYRESHRKIFQSMLRLADVKEPIDLVTMTNALKQHDELEEVGGAAYLATLIDYTPTAANIAYYSKIVAEKALNRRVIQETVEATAFLYGGGAAIEAVEKLESCFAKISSPQKNEPVAATDLVREAAARLKVRYNSKGELQGMPWGIDGLNEATSGIHRGELVVVAGRPSMGKSAFAGNIIRTVCGADMSCLLFSLEMSRIDVTDRFIADRGNVKFHHLRNGRLEDLEWSRNARASEEIRQWKLFIDDTPGINLRQIKSKAKRQKRKGLDLLVIDYLQLMGVSAKDNRVQSLGEISRGLKQLARELDIAVVLLSQLNRSVDSRNDKRPLMSDLRDSGEIEQDADVIVFPFRPAAYCQQCRDKVNNDNHDTREHQAVAEIIIEKQRNGERNISIPVAWLGMFQRFEGI